MFKENKFMLFFAATAVILLLQGVLKTKFVDPGINQSTEQFAEPDSEEPNEVYEESQKNQITKKSTPKKSSISPEKIQKPKLKSVPIVKNKETNGPKYKVPKDFALFKVVGDKAIMSGDIVVGAIKEGFTEKLGLTKFPKVKLWPNNFIHYAIDDGIENKDLILEVIDYFTQTTAVRFIPFQKGVKNFVYFMPTDEHCFSTLGYLGNGGQPLFLSPDCSFKNVVHELMHILGFSHEQSRVDRDDYVEIFWDKIDPEFEDQFYIVPQTNIFDTSKPFFAFDYNSVMMYSKLAFAKDPGKPVMKSTTDKKIEPSTDFLSEKDIQRVNSLYGN